MGAAVTPEDLETLCDLATDYSRYAAEETLREGYLSVRGGFRVGLCGTAVMKDGESTALRDLSSAAVRIAREQRGIGEAVAPRLFRDGRYQNTLLLSPPAAARPRCCGIWCGASPPAAPAGRVCGSPYR
ncbi:MAG: hypothetical protein ACLUIW_10605 [Dysosmobacter welbionis]